MFLLFHNLSLKFLQSFKTKLDSEILKIQVQKINVQHEIHNNQKLKRLKNSQEQLIQTTTKFGQKTPKHQNKNRGKKTHTHILENLKIFQRKFMEPLELYSQRHRKKILVCLEIFAKEIQPPSTSGTHSNLTPKKFKIKKIP